MTALRVIEAGPGVTVQDRGRPGYLGVGLSRGGAADRLALQEGAALLHQESSLAALEMAGVGGTFEADGDAIIALTGAPMRATLDGDVLAWNASHLLPKGARLKIGGALAGCYGYLHVSGGFDTPILLGSRSTHRAARLGKPLHAGDTLNVGLRSKQPETGLTLDIAPRFEGGRIRIVPGPQTALFTEEELARFLNTNFRRDARGDRMGVRLASEGAAFASVAGLSILSEVVTPGDIQITGDGTPYVLLCECQTTGGYPRIGTVLPADLPLIAQARPGAALRFECLSINQGFEAERAERKRIAALKSTLHRLIRHPSEVRDLLSLQLISGMTAGDDLEREAT